MKSPEDRKKTDITPFFEKGKKLDSESYRPVYLTSISRKEMEQMILEVLSKFMRKVMGAVSMHLWSENHARSTW